MTEPDELMISLQDIPAGQACLIGARRWANNHNMKAEFIELLGGGQIPAARVRQTGCPLAEEVCRSASLRQAAERERG